MIVPAVALGGLAVFVVGAALTYYALSWVARLRRRRWHKGRIHLTDEVIERCSVIGGIAAVVLVLVTMFVIPREQALLMWIVLTALGFLVGLLSFLL